MDPLFSLRRNVWQFLSLQVAFKNTKTSRHSEINQTRPSTKQDFSGEALSKQNTEASLASLSWNPSRVPTEWSAIFAFGVYSLRIQRFDKARKMFYTHSKEKSNHLNIYLHVSCLQAILIDSLMTVDTQSTDQSVAQQLTATTYDLFTPL